jgi:hypothetical protein
MGYNERYACLCCREEIAVNDIYCGKVCKNRFIGRFDLNGGFEKTKREGRPLSVDEAIETLDIGCYDLSNNQLVEVSRIAGNVYLDVNAVR